MVYTKDTMDIMDIEQKKKVLPNENIPKHYTVSNSYNQQQQPTKEQSNNTRFTTNSIRTKENVSVSVSLSPSILMYDIHKTLIFKNTLSGTITYTKLSSNQKRKYKRYGIIPSNPSHNLNLWKYSLNHIQIRPKTHTPTPSSKTYIALSPKSNHYHITNYSDNMLIDMLAYETLSYIKENRLQIEDTNNKVIPFDIQSISNKTRQKTNTLSFLSNSSSNTINKNISKLLLITFLCWNNNTKTEHTRY